MRKLYPLFRFLFLAVTLLQPDTASAQLDDVKDCDHVIELAMVAISKNQQAQAIQLLNGALSTARKNNWKKQEFRALNNLGNAYLALFDYGESLDLYLQAYNISIKDLGPEDEILVLNNIAVIYSQEKKYDRAKEYFIKGYALSNGTKDPAAKAVAATNLGNIAIMTADYKQARKYFKEALILMKDNRDRVTPELGLANCDLYEGNLAGARESALRMLSDPKNSDYYHLDMELFGIIADSYFKEGKLDMAELYIRKALAKKPDAESKTGFFKLLTDIYVKGGKLNLALQYKDSLFDATAQLSDKNNDKLYENSKVRFELQNYKNQANLNEAKLLSERKIFYAALLFIIIVLGLSLWLARNVSLKHKQKKLIAESNERILALELEKEKNEMQRLEKQFHENRSVSMQQQEKLETEIDLKNRKLSAKALYLSGRNEIIEEILSELSVLPQVAKDKSLLAHMQSLKSQIKADDEWDDFIKHFEEVNQGFLNALQLKHPALNTNDIRYLCYRYMNLSTKEIASMLNITQDSCRKRKERVYSKMNIATETNLQDYLRSL